MWPFKKKDKPKEINPSVDQEWMPVGEGNPFDAPIMDIRSVALSMVSTTSDPKVAENFGATRSCDGSRYINQEPTDAKSYLTEFSYPHNGEKLEGIVFKSPVMEVKWDIYAYGDWFYFVRSWTSDLVYKARYENTGKALVFREVIASKVSSELEAQNIHSIILTHVLGRVWPYHVPERLRDMSFNSLSLMMFSQFGSKATILTTGNVFNINLVSQS
jgi:hypothetical protein